MKRRYIFLILFFVAIINGIQAEDCVVEYIDGILEIEQDNTWVEVEEGDILPRDAKIRTDNNTIAELSVDDRVYTISAKGIYNLERILANGNDASSWNIGNMVGKKIAIIIDDEIKQYEGSMGVRGDDITDSDEIDWMESSEYIVWEGQKLINDGKHEDALKFFQEAFLSAFDEKEGNEYLFYIGYCYELLGNKTQSLLTLSQLDAPTEVSYYGHFVLLKSRLLAESLSYQKALDLINKYLAEFPGGVYAQAVNFISAFCYRQMNNTNMAVECLKRAYELDPESPIGIEAGKQIKELKNKQE